jgi:zinc transport system ATP-binding protein
MSGGQRQRTLLARALATGSDLLILDEPTTGMDLSGEKSVMDLMADLHRQGGLTVLLVTHHLNLVARYARQIAVLKDRHVTFGPSDEILTGRTLSSIYGTDVHVDSLLGRRIVLTP